MCTEAYRGLKQAGVTILYFYAVFTQELAKKRYCVKISTTSVNIGWLCYLQQWGVSICSHSALSFTHLGNNEFSSGLP